MELQTSKAKSSRRATKSYNCGQLGCGKTFSRKEHLHRHELNHSKTQTWTCHACCTSFVRKDLWRRHWRVRHNGQDPPEAEEKISEDAWGLMKSASSNLAETIQEQPHRAIAVSRLNGFIPKEPSFMPPVSPALGLYPGSNIVDTDDGNANTDLQIIQQTRGEDFVFDLKDWFPTDPVEEEFGAGADLSWLLGSYVHNEPAQSGPTTPHLYSNYGFSNDHPVNSPSRSSVDDQTPQISGHVQGLRSPTCGFRICTALSMKHRQSLLLMLGTRVAEIDPTILTLPSLQQGVHLFSRFVAKEYPILHNQVIAPSPEHADALDQQFGLQSTPELIWAIITFGWSCLEGLKYQPYRQAASMVQNILRRNVISHPSLTSSPPIWLIQTLFFCLCFATYHGRIEDYRFGSLFHGVLVDLIRCLDITDNASDPVSLDIDERGLMHAWFSWIREQTIKRIVFQTFILDIQLAFLHGSNVSFSPFSINYRLPESEEAWFAPTLDKWLRIHEAQHCRPSEFIPSLKTFWTSSILTPVPITFPRGCKVLMYGVLSLAYDLRRRDDNSFSSKPLHSLESLGSKVSKSFEKWLQWWKQTYTHPQMETVHLWRNCACVYRLGHTLYEVEATQWRIMAGVDVIDGRSIGAMEYIRAKRKVKAWMKQDRARVSLAYAATIVQDRLSLSHNPVVHCEHCRWCLYLAGLICWGFGFVSQGNGNHPRIRDDDHARQQCDLYLSKVVQSDAQLSAETFRSTAGLLLALIRILEESDDGDGLSIESSTSLRRLVNQTS